MKKAICFGCIPGKTIEEKFANAVAAGFDGVEVGTLSDNAHGEYYKNLSQKYNVEIHSVMNEYHWQYPLSHPDRGVRQKSIEYLRRSIDTAFILGADTVLVVPAVVNEETSYEEAMKLSIDSIGEVLPYAQEKQVCLGIENVWNKFLLSPIEFAAYIDGFKSPYVKAYFDVGNIVAYGYPHQWINTLGSRIKKVHIKGFDALRHQFVGLLEGTIDWERVMQALSYIGYEGYITAELGVGEKDPTEGLMQISRDMDHILSLGLVLQSGI